MKIKLIAVALATLGACASALAQSAYAVDDSDQLWTVNLSTGASNLIGGMGAFLEGLALSPDGTLYGSGVSGDVYTVNKTTGAATLIGNNGLGDLEGLSFAGGNLWASDFSTPTILHNLNTTTGQDTGFDITTTITDRFARTMAFDPSFQNAWTLNDGPLGQDLWRTDITGTSTLVGLATGLDGQTAAMDFDSSGTLWALGEAGEIYQINTTTGAATLTGNTGGQIWLDMTAAPTPEPLSMITLGAGAAALLARRRRK